MQWQSCLVLWLYGAGWHFVRRSQYGVCFSKLSGKVLDLVMDGGLEVAHEFVRQSVECVGYCEALGEGCLSALAAPLVEGMEVCYGVREECSCCPLRVGESRSHNDR